MGLPDVLAQALANPQIRAALAGAAGELLRGQLEYQNLHWGEPGTGPVALEVPGDARRLVVLGALSRVGYITSKGGERSEFVHMFGDLDEEGRHVGPRPILAVGTYEGGRQELVILRGKSQYSVTRHGIEG